MYEKRNTIPSVYCLQVGRIWSYLLTALPPASQNSRWNSTTLFGFTNCNKHKLQLYYRYIVILKVHYMTAWLKHMKLFVLVIRHELQIIWTTQIMYNVMYVCMYVCTSACTCTFAGHNTVLTCIPRVSSCWPGMSTKIGIKQRSCRITWWWL